MKLQASFCWKQFNEFTAQAEEVRRRLFGFSAVRDFKKKVPLTSLPPKSFLWASNSECSMGTLFALPTLKLGGSLKALGGRFLQARFSPMPL